MAENRPRTPSIGLPGNPDAERYLIGWLLNAPRRFAEVREMLTSPDAFQPGADREIYRAMCILSDRGVEPDPHNVAVYLHDSGASVGSDVIGDRLTGAPVTGGMDLASKILGYWIRREAIQKAEALRVAAANQDAPLAEVEARASEIPDCFLRGIPGQGSTELRDIMADVLANALNGPKKPSIPTFSPTLNRITGGMKPGELDILAARTSNGKTALALELLAGAAFRGHKVGIFSLEMPQEALAQRMCAVWESIDAQKFRNHRLNQSDIQAIKRFQQRVQTCSIRVYDSPRVDPDVIRATCRAWARKGGLDFVVIDYLQLINPTSGGRRDGTREREVAEISRAMKQLAVELNVPILLLAQLNREMEKNGRLDPKLSDLRESGAIEQDADQVWLLSGWDPATTDDVVPVTLKVAKSRSSATGKVPLEYVRKYLRFQEVGL